MLNFIEHATKKKNSQNVISTFLVFFIFGYVADVDFESLVGTCPQN